MPLGDLAEFVDQAGGQRFGGVDVESSLRIASLDAVQPGGGKSTCAEQGVELGE